MKRLFIPLGLMAMMAACSSEAPKEDHTQQATDVVDTVAVKMDETQKDIEESAKEVDELLKDL